MAHLRVLSLALVVLSVVAAQRSASADTFPSREMPCREAELKDPSLVFSQMTRSEIIRRFEVIVEGTIESQISQEVKSLRGPTLAIMRVEKVLKGYVAPRVAWSMWTPPTLEWQPPWDPRNCPVELKVGQRVRIGSGIVAKGADLIEGYPTLDMKTDFVGRRSFFWSLVYLPLSDAELGAQLAAYDEELIAYEAKTDSLQRAATTGGLQAKLAFLQHLYDNNERHRAQEAADALRREGVKLATLGPLLLNAERKDWSDLKRVHDTCYSDHANLDNAIFDHADFAECAFRYSSFRDASFRGTDLTGSYFQNSDLTGAKYDCSTKLPDDLDPATAGMINVEGACSKP